jgi:hypothetical protein
MIITILNMEIEIANVASERLYLRLCLVWFVIMAYYLLEHSPYPIPPAPPIILL